MRNYIRNIVKLFAGNNYSATTCRRIWRWMAEDEYSSQKDEVLHELWEEAKTQELPGGKLEGALRRMRQNTGIGTNKKKQIFQMHVWQAAAVFFMLFSSVSVYWIANSEKNSENLIQSYIPSGDLKTLALPDGTQVLLNSQSTLLYPDKFDGDTRSVFLIGEANFKVMPDSKHPFIVKTNDIQVTALGTEFMVSAYPEDDELHATLLSGSVLVEFDGLTSSRKLSPNESFSYNKKTKQSKVVLPDIAEVTAWKRGELVFDGLTLDEIFTRLERKYPYTFIYSLNSLKKDSYSFRFSPTATLEEIISVITQVVGSMDYRLEGNKCYLYGLN